MADRYVVTIRRRGVTQKSRHPSLEATLAALADALVDAAGPRSTERALVRDIPPVGQVAVRAELRGPGRARGGVDLRGDGSTEAFTGRFARRPVPLQPGEDAVEALRRVLDRRS